MAIQYDLEHPTVVPHFTRCRPGPVRKLNGAAGHRGHLVLQWQPPRGGAPVSGYRVERTKDGKAYETIGETAIGWFCVRVVPGEEWFYRVSAYNARGATQSTLVCFYRAQDRFVRGGHNVKPLLQHIPVVPGLTVTVCEFGPAE